MQIYAACLASYNAGVLHGRWIDLDLGVSHVREEIATMLRESPHPNVTVKCAECGGMGVVFIGPDMSREGACPVCSGWGGVPAAEEWAIHDYDGIGSSWGEHPDLAELCEFVTELERADDDDNREAFLLWYENVRGGTYSDFLGEYAGAFPNRAEFAKDYVDSAGLLHGVPETVAHYFDFDSYGHDLLMSDAYEIDGHYFWHR